MCQLKNILKHKLKNNKFLKSDPFTFGTEGGILSLPFQTEFSQNQPQ